MNKFKTRVLIFLFLPICGMIFSQEALKSGAEEYYDFLALQGLAARPFLNYRTLSDSVWNIADDLNHPWQNQNLGTRRRLFGDFSLRIYGPELFMSANTEAPYGQNDGALWQGKGFNTSLTGGIRLEAYGVEATFKPQLAFSQNSDFDIMPSNYDSEYGYFWGYSHNAGVDAPQRFGDKPFFAFDWGDSEIRYSWKTLTIGFGTQPIWLGPAYLNPVLHSNNAPSYPKFDMGIRKQPITIPWINWYMGDVEFRIWTGYLSESDYFDNNPANDHIMFHGLSFAYAPSFLPGLTLSVNRVCLVPWEWENLKYIFPSDDNTIEDQKASFGLSYYFPQVGFEVFAELGIDDYPPDRFIGIIRYPFRSTVYSFGIKKEFTVSRKKLIYGELVFESNWLEMTQEFQLQWPYSLYFHHLVTQGYTNKGQYLGSGIGSGGNQQYLGFILYYPKGKSSIFIGRNNPDNNYIYKNAVYDSAAGKKLEHYIWDTKSNFFAGFDSGYFLNSSIMITGGLSYNLIINPKYERTEDNAYIFVHNFRFVFGAQYFF
ncbi:MAG: capsule assembly Wzi family protein [Treponema sp.]|jgi:hypothetical protein|nr:capsule assembly Wzi family protein [Treponema sp.]